MNTAPTLFQFESNAVRVVIDKNGEPLFVGKDGDDCRAGHLTLQRLRRNQPLTPSDLDELGKMLVDAGGSTEVIQ